MNAGRTKTVSNDYDTTEAIFKYETFKESVETKLTKTYISGTSGDSNKITLDSIGSITLGTEVTVRGEDITDPDDVKEVVSTGIVGYPITYASNSLGD